MGAHSRPGPPAADRPALVRERLLDRLRERWSTPVTVVSAPAGYGKTTLLAHAVAAGAAAPSRIDRLVTCEPRTTAVALAEALCRAVEIPPPAGTLDQVVAAVREAMRRRGPDAVCLLVDDVHEVPPGTEAAGLLVALVASLPPNGHVVLAGRPPLPVPVTGPGRRRRVVVLDETDLAFTADELAEFAALRGVPDARVSDCGGWPALAELSAAAPSTLARDYVEQEVLSRLPAARRRDLAVLAQLGPVDDDLARAALGRDLHVADLTAGIPLVTAGTGGERTLHRLWRSLLAPEVTPAEIEIARRRAAARLGQRGRAPAAVPLLIGAGTADDLSRALVASLAPPRPRVPHDVLADWLAALPADVRADPAGQLLAAVVVAETDPGRAWRRFEAAAAAFRARGDAAGELTSLVHLCEVAWWSGRPERLDAVAARIFELDAEGCAAAAPVAGVARALLGDVRNDDRRVLADLDRVSPEALHDAAPRDEWRAVVSSLRAVSLLRLGDAEAALAHADRALDGAGPLHGPLVEATRLQALWCLGRTAEVQAALPGVLRRVDRSGCRHGASLVAAQGCVVHAFQGQRERAADYLAQARTYAAAAEAPMVRTALAVAEAALAVAEGDEAAAGTALAAELARRPLDQGVPATAHRRSLALIYALVPASRPAWDRAELGPALAVARDLARVAVAVRAGGFPPDAPPLPEATVVQAHLPRPWVAELGTAAVAAGREDGARLVEGAWPAIRGAMTRLADHRDPPLRKAARATLGRLAAPPTAPLVLRLLGPLELRRDDVPVPEPEWRRDRVRSLLAYLALHRTVGREQLADDLWPGLDTEGQYRNFRVTLTYLLRVLEPDRAPRGASFFVRQQDSNVTLHPGGWLTVDVTEFDAACARAEEADRRASPTRALAEALRAVELWRGDPTDLASESWAVAPLEERRVRFAATATRAAQLLLDRGNVDRARVVADQALAVDPWLEAAHRVVVASHRAAGDNLGARRALARYREALDELGVPPDEAADLVRRLLDGPRHD